jgi:hypothetical protein
MLGKILAIADLQKAALAETLKFFYEICSITP